MSIPTSGLIETPAITYGVAFLVALLIVVTSVPFVKSLALNLGCVDVPNSRKVHQQPMARLGGIAIFGGTVTASLLLWTLGDFAPFSRATQFEISVILLGGSAFFILGLLDDLLSLSSVGRLLCQFAIATLIWFLQIRIEFITIPSIGLVHLGLWSLPITLLWIVGLVNAVNWIDGLDGLASGVSGISTLIIFVICLLTGQPAVALLAICLIGSLCGFLIYNFNPAHIFMGDGGSYFIGFMVAALSITGLIKGATATIFLMPLAVLGVPILDMVMVIFSRLLRGRSPFVADKTHLHHRLMQLGLPHRWAVLVIYALTLWVGSWSFTMTSLPYGLLIVIVATVVLMVTTWRAWQLTQPA